MSQDTKDYDTIDSFSQFIQILKVDLCSHVVYRGVSDFNYSLKTTFARKIEAYPVDLTVEDYKELEQTLFEVFKSRATAHMGIANLTEWQWLILAQHYGLATRLLDWTENPLVAFYFAVCDEKNLDKDGGLYMYHFIKAISIDDYRPFEIPETSFFVPPYLTNRIVAQSSVFSISERPWLDIESDLPKKEKIYKIRITKEFKKEMVQLLPRFGISKRVIFSDLGSYAEDISQFFLKDSCPHKDIFTVTRKRKKKDSRKFIIPAAELEALSKSFGTKLDGLNDIVLKIKHDDKDN